jgi:predicted metal-dependent phosphoesterase TrpH
MKALCAVVSCFLLLHAEASEPSKLKLTRTIAMPDVQSRMDHLAVDTQRHRLFVAALGNDSVEVLDLNAAKRVQRITDIKKPQGLLFLPKGNHLWVASGGDGRLRIFDGANLKLIKTLAALEDADNLRYDAKANRVYVGYGNGAIGIVDAMTGVRTGYIQVLAHPEAFQLEPNGDRIFVNVPDAKHVAVLDRQAKTLLEGWLLRNVEANFPMAFDEGGQRLFIGCRKPARFVVLETKTGGTVAEVPIDGDTDDLFYDARLRRLYVACGEGFLDVIEQQGADNFRLLEKIPTAAGARTCLFSPESNELYLAVPRRGNQSAEVRVFQPQK